MIHNDVQIGSSIHTPEGFEWVPLMDYAIKNNVSLSTLRRHIKANKVHFRIEGNKYFLLDHSLPELSVKPLTPPVNPFKSQNNDSDLLQKIRQLESQLRKTQEEVTDLKTLLALYEDRWGQSNVSNFDL
jgi:hypothetical protein